MNCLHFPHRSPNRASSEVRFLSPNNKMLLLPQEIQQNNKTKDLGVLGKQRLDASKIFLFFWFLVPF